MKVLLTGSSGSIGTLIRPLLADKYDEVILNSRSHLSDLRKNETAVYGDITDPDFLDSLVKGVDGIIHLAGLVGPDYSFEESLQPNFVSVYHLFEAAHRYRVQKVVYASTNHAVGFYERGTAVDNNSPPRADSWYGVTKACGEILASHAADKYGLDVMCIRIGYVEETVPDERRKHTWCSPRDLVSLIDLGLTGPQKGFQMVYGISNCPEPLFDNSYAESLGYRSADNSLDHLADPSLENARPDPANPEHKYIGGYFAVRKEGEKSG